MSFRTCLSFTWSMIARGLVLSPTDAQKIAMFCETIPASSAAQTNFKESFPKENREISETKRKMTGARTTNFCRSAISGL